MERAKDGDKVSVHYSVVVTGESDPVDSSEGREPLSFTVGAGQMLPGFEAAVKGMAEGESKVVELQAAEAYGEHREELLLDIEKGQLPKGPGGTEAPIPDVGEFLHFRQEGSPGISLKVLAIEEDSLKVDANHPLAGKDLTFDLTLVKIGE